jgi:hypothetical protein
MRGLAHAADLAPGRGGRHVEQSLFHAGQIHREISAWRVMKLRHCLRFFQIWRLANALASNLRGRGGGTDVLQKPSYKTQERRGEAIYDEMYERGSPLGLLSEIKECFEAAMVAAETDGLAVEAKRLRARLDHMATVFHRQFT